MTENAIRVVSVVFGFVAASMVLPQCAAAQSLEALDQLVLASAKPADGLALARSQAGSGALLDALATLERVLLTDPGSKPASLLHASILCRIDDRDGAAAEFARLKAKDFKKPEWAAARAPCDAPAASRQGAAK
jgi:hypothetical protein